MLFQQQSPYETHCAQSALEFIAAGGVFYWINVLPAGAMIAHH